MVCWQFIWVVGDSSDMLAVWLAFLKNYIAKSVEFGAVCLFGLIFIEIIHWTIFADINHIVIPNRVASIYVGLETFRTFRAR